MAERRIRLFEIAESFSCLLKPVLLVVLDFQIHGWRRHRQKLTIG
jgi:hypothetical protein